MAHTVFQDFNQNNPIVSSWLNDVDGVTYAPSGLKKVAANSAAAWVRFSVAAGVVTIQQSLNVLSVTRSSAGIFTIAYTNPMTNATNAYDISTNQAGFVSYGAETVNGVAITCANTSNVATDPGSVCVIVYGNN